LTAAALSDGDAAGAINALCGAALPDGAGALVVGHQPLLGYLAGFFLAREAFAISPAGFIRLTTFGAGFAADPAAALTEYYDPAGSIS